MVSLLDEKSSVRFACNICGLRAPHAILCTKKLCPTEILVDARSHQEAWLIAQAIRKAS